MFSGKQWITTYNGSPKKITVHYRKRFHVDAMTAMKDLQAIGVEFTQEYLNAVKKSGEARVHQFHLQKKRNTGRKMKQQFIGLKHCKCGTSWMKDTGYFKRTKDMVFALERKTKGKKVKQIPVIRYKNEI